MVKSRAISLSPQSRKRRLVESVYQWNYRPSWEYAGKPRILYGQEVDARSFSIRSNSSRGIIWTVDMQCWAVEQGFFVHRELIRERPVIIGVNRYDHTFSYWEPYAAMMEIERRVFRRLPRYGVLLDFIKQQDLYGYTGAWEERVQCYTPDLLWYKMHIQATGGMGARKRRLAQNAANARDGKFLKRVRSIINDGY